jgi:hypothetical protein
MVLAALVAVSLALSAPYAEIADIADSSMRTDASMKTDISMKTDVSKKADASIIIPNEYFSPTNHTPHPGDELHLCSDVDMKLSSLKRSHMGGGAYCCDICDVAFTPSHDPLVVPATGDDTKEERLCCPTLNTTDGEGITVYLNASSHYYAHNKCPNCEKSAWHGCKGILAIETVNTVPIAHDESRFGLELSITNLTEYSPVWPMANHENHRELERLGYLQNGLKSDGEEAHDLLQVSLCNNRYVKNQMCFGSEVKDNEYKSGYRPVKVRMGRAAIRIFVLDHAGNTPWVKGPDALQFNCTGGTFSLFGDHPYISYTAGEPILEEEDFTANGQSKYTYLCPDNDIPVTIWSKFTATDSFDNPHTSNMPNLTKAAEDAMVLIEYENVDCVTFTFANMPPRYTQNGYTDAANPAHNIDAWVPDAEASLGGNPLNSSNELSTAGGYTDLSTRMCEPTGYGRNWVMAGYALDDTTAPCTDLRLSQDPMFVVNGEHRHFWLPTGEMTPLLSWENYGVKLVLKGETFGSPRGQTQWFGNFSVFADHHEVIRVNVRTGAMKLGKEHKKLENQTLNTVEVFVDGNPVTGFGKVKSERGRDCSITAAKLPVRLIGHAHAESVDIDVPGLSMTISSAKAGKYESNTARQVRWAHLNMKMRSSLPSDPSGLVAELAGFNPLSKKSKEYLRVPKAVKEHRLKMKGKKDEDEDEDEDEKQQQQQQQQQEGGRGKSGKSGGGVLLADEPDSVFDLP